MALAEGIDSAADQLRATLSSLEDGIEHFSEASDQLDELLSSFSPSVDEFGEVLGELKGAAKDMTGRLEEVESEFSSAAEDFSTSIESNREAVEAAHATTQSSMEEVRGQAAEWLDSLRAADSDLADKDGEGQEQLQAMKTQADEARAAIEELFAEIKTSIGALQEAFDSSNEQTSEGVTQTAAALEETIAGELRERLEALLGNVQDQLTSGILDGITQTQEGLEGASGVFGTTSEEMSEEMSQRLEELLDELITYAKEKIESEVSEAIEEMIEDFVTAFMAEIVKNVVMTQLGAQITASMSTALPQLIGAKKALEIINKFL